MQKKPIMLVATICLALSIGSHGGAGSHGNREMLKVPLTFFQLWNGQADTLSGLEAVYVVVFLDENAKRVGLFEDTLKAQVELLLQGNGIPTIPEEDFTSASILTKRLRDFVAGGYVVMKEAEYPRKMGDYGRLQFEITLTGTEYPIGATVRLTLCQTGLLPSNLPEKAMIAPCVTWIDATIGVYGEKVIKERISDKANVLAGRFCSDYLAAHEKEKEESTGE